MGIGQFRRATLDDAAAITALTRAAYALWVPVIGREPLPMTIDYVQAVQDHLIDLVHQDNAVVGLIEMVPKTDHLWIENVAVAPAVKGRGLGRRLMAHAETVALGLGLPEIRLLTNVAFAENLPFYQSLGFSEDRREPFRGGTTVYFRKVL